MAAEKHTLIPPKQALEILTFVSAKGLYIGAKGTDVLTRFPHGLYSKEECEALRDSIIAAGVAGRSRRSYDRRSVPEQVV